MRHAVLFSFFLAAAVSATPLSIGTHAITARGMTPGGNVVIFGVALQYQGYESRAIRTLTTITADGTGVASYVPPQRLDVRGVWFAIDEQTGVVSSGMPSGSPATIKDVTNEAGNRAGAATFSRMFASYLDVLLVRPGKGVWSLNTGTGGPGDDNRQPGAGITVSFSRFHGMSKDAPPAPAALTPGDAVIAIEPATLKAYTLTLAR